MSPKQPQLEGEVFYPAPDVVSQARIKDWEAVARKASEDLEGFWAAEAEELEWYRKWDKVLDASEKPFFKWFKGAQTNIVHNCLDRHQRTWRKNKLSLVWVGEKGEVRTYSYFALNRDVSKFANVLKAMGVKKGDRVTIYMPRVPEIVIAMLAAAKIGAIHSVVYGGFSVDALQGRIEDSESKVVLTADGGFMNGKIVELKKTVDEAVRRCPTVETVIVVQRTAHEVRMEPGRDYWYHDLMKLPLASAVCPTEVMESNDPLYILYTSGTTGKPKGIILSGGPASVYDEDVPTADRSLLDANIPVLGLCYGMQLLAHLAGGKVVRASRREYGRADVRIEGGKLFESFGRGEETPVWMSHGDHVDAPPPGFSVTASSENSPVAAFEHRERPLFGVQFHPEVAHTPRGGEILNTFLFEICGCTPDWTPGHFVESEIERVRATVGPRERVICGLSGGVDSSVAAVLVHRAVGDRLTCIFVDHGLLRLHEREQVETTFRRHLGIGSEAVFSSVFNDAVSNPLDQLLRSGSEITATRTGSIVALSGFRRPRVKILRIGKPLCEKSRSHDVSFMDYQRTIGLLWK